MQELSQHVLDLAQNAVEAGARHVRIEVVEDVAADRIVISVEDDGRGMDEATVRMVADPFYTTRTTRRVGLGLSLLAQTAEAAGGGLSIKSQLGVGTKVTVTYQRSHIDRPPLGDLSGTVLVLVAGNPEVTFEYRHVADGREFEFDGGEIQAALGELSPQHPAVLRWLLEALAKDSPELP